VTSKTKCLFRHELGFFCGEEKGHGPPHRVDKALTNCNARGCVKAIDRKRLMCPKHWNVVSPELQAAVWKAYRGGGAGDWVAARDAAVDHVAARESSPRHTIERISDADYVDHHALPEGKTCRDCRLMGRCATRIGRRGHEVSCPYLPSRFVSSELARTEPEVPDATEETEP
jgi:hypothetical protein